jgi:hypothetical protein
VGAFIAIYATGFLFAWIVGASKGRGAAGFFLGLLFSWVGFIIALCLSSTAEAQGRVPCPQCAEMILPAASVCPHCHSRLKAVEGWYPDPYGRHPDRWWDGSTWTRSVRDKPGGTRSEDPVPT